MSSFSRRACFKCGLTSHIADQCPSAERLCYNCKQPGHESNGCPLPRTTEAKQCYHCGGIGHIQSDCPTLRLSGGAGMSGRCYACNQPGHVARACPNAAGGGPLPGVGRGSFAPRGGYAGGFSPRGGFAGGPRQITCHRCGGPNHHTLACLAPGIKCYSCGKFGHTSKDCTAPNGGPLSTAGKICYRCKQPGHIQAHCPETLRNGVAGGDVLAVESKVGDMPKDTLL